MAGSTFSVGRTLLTLAVALGLAAGGCARDVSGGAPVEIIPNSVRLGFRMRDTLATDTWYYTVFNFTQTTAGVDVSPFDEISNEDRGHNWQLYIAYKPAVDLAPAKFVTLQRPAFPTVIPTARQPTDVAVADFGGDAQPDILVAARGDGVVQLVRATTSTNLLDPVFYDLPIDVYSGVAPQFLFGRDFTGDALADALLVDAGDASSAPHVLLLTRSGDSTFTAGTAIPLTGAPVDAVLTDLNADSQMDLVVATTGATQQLEILLGSAGGAFFAPTSFALSTTARNVVAGELTGDANRDLVVGFVSATGADAVQILAGDGAGGFTPGESRSTPGELRGVTVGDLNGTRDDIVVTYQDAANGGTIGAFLRNDATPALAADLVTEPLNDDAGYVIVDKADGGADVRPDAIVADGNPTAGDRISIMRGEREVDPINPLLQTFIWNEEEVVYPSALGPSRLRAAHLNADTNIDIIAVNSADDNDGNSISLYFGLGKSNFTNSDIYWTDDPPNDAAPGLQPWLLNASVGPNNFDFEIDPGLFFDLARQAPDQFFVTFMTGTTGIDLESNLDQLGIVQDALLEPVRVPMDVGFTNDEQQTPLASQHTAPLGSQDIVYWYVEVL